MVTFNFEDGSSMTLQDKDTTTVEETKGTVSGVPVYDSATSKVIKETDVKTTTDTGQKEETKTLKYQSKSMRAATPLSVINQFSDGFIEALLALPDYTVEKTAQGISDTFNLGWNDDDIFQFADLINKGKIGYMGGATYIGGDGMTPELIEALSLPQNEWEKWARLSGEISGLGASFFTGGTLLNLASAPMKYRKLVQTANGKWEWVTDAAKIAQADKKYPGLTGSAQEYMNWIANNPLKAAQLDLLFSTGGATGLYTADRNMTEEFKEQHPILASLVETGALLVGSLAAPGVVLGTAKTLQGGGILLTKTPVAGPILKFTGNVLSELWSKRSVAAQRAYIRKIMKENIEPKIAKQIQEQYEIAMNDPSTLYPKNVAMVVKSNVVSGDAINALKQEFRDNGASEEEAMTKIWNLILKTANDAKPIESLSGGETIGTAVVKTVQIGNKEYELGELAEQALQAYYRQLQTKGNLSEQQIQKMIDSARLQLSMAETAPSASSINTQGALEATASGERLGSIIDRKQTNKKIIQSFNDALFPTDEHAATVVIDSLSGKILSVNKIGQTVEDLEREAILLAKESLPVLQGETKVSIGQNLRQTAINLKKEAMAPFEREDLYINEFGDGIKVANFNWYQDTLRHAIYGKTGKPGLLDIPEEMPAIIQKILNLDANPSVLEVWRLYKGLSDQAFDAGLSASMGQGPGKAGYHNLQLAQEKLMSFMQDAMVKIGDRKLSQFFQEYKVKVANIFNRNAAFKVNMRTVGGGYLTADELVPYEYFKTAETAKQFGLVYNSMPTNTEAQVAAKQQVFKNIEAVILDMIWNGKGGAGQIVNKEGIIDARKLNQWIEKNDTWLHKFGDIKGRLLNLKDTQKKIATRIETQNARIDNITATMRDEKLKPLIDIVNSEIRAGMDAVPESIRGEVQDNLIYTVNQLVQKALIDPVLMRRLSQEMGFGTKMVWNDPAGIANSFRKLIWQNVGDKIKIENPGKVIEWMESATGKNVLNLVYTKPQQGNLRTILNAYEVVFTTPLPTGSAESQMPWIAGITKVLGSSPQSLTSIRRAWSEGRISGANVLIYVASRLVTAQQKQMFDKIYYQAFSDPKIAEQLAKNLKFKNQSGFFYDKPIKEWAAKKVQEFLFSNGISLPLEVLTEPPLIITNDTEYEIKPSLKEIRVPLKFGEDEQSRLAPMNMEIPDVVQASRLAGPTQDERKGVEMAETAAVETTPTGTIMEEDYASFFPHDTTGQMIAARRAAEGGIMSVNKQQRQRVL